LLNVENVTKRFGGLMALRDVTFAVSEGQIKSIIGPNGAGKTTLFNVISGFTKPDGGEIRFCDQPITGKAPEGIARVGIARTFQVVKPFNNLTVIENVLIGSLGVHGRLSAAKESAREVLDHIGMADKADWPARKLTLEDLKRMELGRALATGPKLLLLDEVMAGLNPTEVDEFMDLIRRIRDDGIAILLIEHIMHSILSLSDEVLVLDYGEKVYEGNPRGAVEDPRVIEAYLGEEYFLT